MRTAIQMLNLPDSSGSYTVLDVGSRIVTGQKLNYKPLFPAPVFTYLGMDIEAGDNVDVVVALPYDWKEFRANSFDVVVTGQVLEHVPYFWDVFQEMERVLKPGGAVIVIVPSKGAVHRHPVDCYRFHPDGLIALAHRSNLQIRNVVVDEGSYWGDVMLVARKLEHVNDCVELPLGAPQAANHVISRITRSTKLIDIMFSMIAVLIGDRAFISIVDLRNRLRSRIATRSRR
jgi:SAM-dependent methyltransferase